MTATDGTTTTVAGTPAALDPARRTLAGAASALLGLATSEVAGLVIPGSPSPTTAVAGRIIELTPDGPREALIGAVGTADKPLLVLGIIVTVVISGALAGFFARPERVPMIFAVAGAATWAFTYTGNTDDALGLAIVLVAGVLVGSLTWNRLVRGAAIPRGASSAQTDAGMDRRTFLQVTGVVAAAGVLGVGFATVIRRSGAAAIDAVRSALTLPKPTDPAPELPAAIDPGVPGLAPAVTPNADFYQIDTALVAPSVETDGWTLTVDGRVTTPLTLSYADLLALPSIERYVALTCVSNEVGGDLVGTAKWQGVRLADVLAKVGVNSDATALVGESVDGFTAGFPLSVLDDGRDAMIAYAMNDEPLPVKHGFPARLVVPGLYGYVSATKWLSAIRLTTLEETVPFWIQRSWSADGTIELSSRIDVPRTSTRIAGGTTAVGGRAWHQHRGVKAVQVRVDGGAWEDATLAAGMGNDAWRLWSWQWSATPGQHLLECRARSLDGTWQTEDERPVFPGASSGLHAITVDVG